MLSERKRACPLGPAAALDWKRVLEEALALALECGMQFYLPEAARAKVAKFQPRHFVMLANFFGSPEWVDDLACVRPGAWTMVIRAPGSYCFGRELATRRAGAAFIFEQLTAEELAALEQRDGTLLCDFGWEVLFPRADVVASMIDGLAEFNIDPSRIRLLHNNLAARAAFEEHWREQTDAPAPHSLEFPSALALCVAYQQKHKSDLDIESRKQAAIQRTQEGSRSKLFVSFNGEARLQRLFVIADLLRRNLLDSGHVSLLYSPKGRNNTNQEFRDMVMHKIRNFTDDPNILGAVEDVIDRLPMTLDLDNIPKSSLEEVAWTSQNPELYDDSNISLVIDTVLWEQDTLFVTEKVLKPIMNHSPFLLVGGARACSLLRDYGFQTFEPEMTQPETGDASAIMGTAVDEIERLSLLNPSELADFSRALMDRCTYNANHFWTDFPKRLAASFQKDVLSTLWRNAPGKTGR